MSNDAQRGWISRNVNFNGVQARIKIDGTEISKAFTYAQYASRAATERAAQQWLVVTRAQLPSRRATALRTTATANKADPSLPAGVFDTSAANRSGSRTRRFQVLWHDGKQRRIKSFTYGTEETATEASYRNARKQAIAFRRAYEAARRSDKPFHGQVGIHH